LPRRQHRGVSRSQCAAFGFHPCGLSAFLWQFTGIG